MVFCVAPLFCWQLFGGVLVRIVGGAAAFSSFPRVPVPFAWEARLRRAGEPLVFLLPLGVSQGAVADQWVWSLFLSHWCLEYLASILSLSLPMSPGSSTGNPDIEYSCVTKRRLFHWLAISAAVFFRWLCMPLFHMFAVERISAIYCLTERCS